MNLKLYPMDRQTCALKIASCKFSIKFYSQRSTDNFDRRWQWWRLFKSALCQSREMYVAKKQMWRSVTDNDVILPWQHLDHSLHSLTLQCCLSVTGVICVTSVTSVTIVSDGGDGVCWSDIIPRSACTPSPPFLICNLRYSAMHQHRGPHEDTIGCYYIICF